MVYGQKRERFEAPPVSQLKLEFGEELTPEDIEKIAAIVEAKRAAVKVKEQQEPKTAVYSRSIDPPVGAKLTPL
jgi:hypothetical protein